MIDEGMNTMQIRALRVSHNRITRISRDETGNPPGLPKRFNNEHFNFNVETILTDPRHRASQLQDIFKKNYLIPYILIPEVNEQVETLAINEIPILSYVDNESSEPDSSYSKLKKTFIKSERKVICFLTF